MRPGYKNPRLLVSLNCQKTRPRRQHAKSQFFYRMWLPVTALSYLAEIALAVDVNNYIISVYQKKAMTHLTSFPLLLYISCNKL